MLSHLQVQDFYARHLSMVMAGRMEEMSGIFLYPFTVHERDFVYLLPDAEALATRWREVQAFWRAAGVADLRPRVAALELPRHGRFRFWAESTLLAADGRSLGANKTLYYSRTDQSGAIKIEMMQILSVALATRCTVSDTYLKA